MEEIWYNDIINFLDINKLLVFFPSTDMDYTQKLNCLMRLTLYICVIIYSITNNYKVVYMLVVIGLATMFMENMNKSKETYIENDHGDIDYDEKIKLNCYKPTKENPFMNVLMNEYVEDPERPKACDIKYDNVTNNVNKNFYKNLFRSLDDVFNKDSSVRQYYTNPSTTIPNDQEAFANWLYKTEKTCKEEGGEKNCRYYTRYVT